MPPMPKDPRTRQRRNQSSTAATLVADPKLKAPELPGDDWSPRTLAFWQDIWSSPMAPEYDPSDIHGLILLAACVEQFWRKPSALMAAEIRQQRQVYGLSPLDRRRLQWTIARAEDADEKSAKRRPPARKPAAEGTADPRSVLTAVS